MSITKHLMPTQSLAANTAQSDAYFGTFFQLMRESLVAGGSEMALGMTLFSLAVSVRAAHIVEIGRFKGFSTLALASALKFNDLGWDEPAQHKQRPDINYQAFEGRERRQVMSIDPMPTTEASNLIARAALTDYVTFVNLPSNAVDVSGEIDLLFVDGDHTYEGCVHDVMKYVPSVRPGGYFILHDYYGWYEGDGLNKSPIKRAVDEIPHDRFPRVLIDTGYQSFVVFHRPRTVPAAAGAVDPGQ
jgi:predicted O-methyltransferase YrrM